jgi:pimeloyl-ACP methyl ester carboxylesterase
VLAHGYEVLQLESPYTAAVSGRMAAYRRGDFGTRDARVAAEAVAAVRARLGRPPVVLIGHSYGAYLAARMAGLIPAVTGVATMNGLWTTADLAELARTPTSDGLAEFLRRALPHRLIPLETEPRPPACWLVIYGSEDRVIPPGLYRAAIARDGPERVQVIEGEGHVARGRHGVVGTLTAIDAWLGEIAGAAGAR